MACNLHAKRYPLNADRWRGLINPSNEWFSSYQDFVNYWAQMAQSNKVEAFCIGCEPFYARHSWLRDGGLNKTVSWSSSPFYARHSWLRDGGWRNVIQNVRTRFTGPITYTANPCPERSRRDGNETNINWWAGETE